MLLLVSRKLERMYAKVNTKYFGEIPEKGIWPDTLNFEDMAQFSQNFLYNAVDFADSLRPYFYCFYGEDPPELCHNIWDHSEDLGRFLYGSIFARLILGDEEEPEIERVWKQMIYDSIPDGERLSFRPVLSPYDPYRDKEAEQRLIAAFDSTQQDGVEADIWDNRSVFTGLFLSYLVTGDLQAKERAAKMVEEMKRISIRRGTWAFLSKFDYPLGYEPNPNEQPCPGQNMQGWIRPLVFYYEQTGDVEALELARGYAQCFIDLHPESFHDFAPRVTIGYNTHAFMYGLAGIIRCGRLTGSQKFISWSKHHYDEIMRELGTEMGWVAEQFPAAGLGKIIQSAETCTVADAIDVAIQLAQCGYPEYWGKAERLTRNYLVEAQLTDVSWMINTQKKQDDFQSTYDNVPERIKGCYVGWGAPNDFVDPKARRWRAIQNCCGPHGVFGTYMVWSSIVTYKESCEVTGNSGVYVNMAINRDSQYAQVKSYLPFEGRVDITMHQRNDLFVRIPEWVDSTAIKVQINGMDVDVKLSAGYIELGEVEVGSLVVVRYPLRRCTTREEIEGTVYTLSWKGDTVVAIEPGGTIAPMFQRSYMKDNEAPVQLTSMHRSRDTIAW